MIMCVAGCGVALTAGWLHAQAPQSNRAEAHQIPASTQHGQKTVWDGVFTEEQAARGRQHYRRFCGHCHSDDLSGGGDGEPALAGAIFMAQWRERSVAELFAVISETMPYSAPGSLRGQEYVDIVSYLLRANGVPTGQIELSYDREKLKQILVTDLAADQPPRP
jgi:cytochrome c5